MELTPRRLPGLLLGFGLLALITGIFWISLAQLGLQLISGSSLLWIGLMLLALPLTLLVLNRLYGLLTARYRLDRDGLYLRWGLAYEQVPIGMIRAVHSSERSLRPRFGFWWPGCVVGRTVEQELGSVEFFATVGELVMVELDGERSLAITPPDPEAFQAGYSNALHMGALERIPHRSERPEALLNQIWADWLARGAILAGLLLPLAMLVALIVRAPALPAEVRFGYGAEAPLVPLARLTLLPMIAGLVWLADLLTGAWFYRRRRDRPLAYVLWIGAVVIGLLLAGAVLRFALQ